MKISTRHSAAVFSSILLLSACDPHNLDTTAAGAVDSQSNAAFEVLSNDNTDANFKELVITSSGISSGNEYGLYTNPIELNKGEPFVVSWEFSVDSTSQFRLEFKEPENPDANDGGFFSFSSCESGGNCGTSSTTCEYNTDSLEAEGLGRINCTFVHPDLGVEIINAPSLSAVLDKTIDDLPEVFELRAQLCSSGACDIVRSGFVRLNK